MGGKDEYKNLQMLH
ncbi:MAG: hypothetical protein V7K40_28260 [Nostoc sp.]